MTWWLSQNQRRASKALKQFLKRVEKYSLKLNPKKSIFGVTFSKMLGYMVSHNRIKVDPYKSKVIKEMSMPKIEKEIRGFIGKLQFISRFITKLTVVCEPIFKLLRKDQPVRWKEQCQWVFDKIKKYLANPPVMKPPKSGLPLTLYLAIEGNAIGAMLA